MAARTKFYFWHVDSYNSKMIHPSSEIMSNIHNCFNLILKLYAFIFPMFALECSIFCPIMSSAFCTPAIQPSALFRSLWSMVAKTSWEQVSSWFVLSSYLLLFSFTSPAQNFHLETSPCFFRQMLKKKNQDHMFLFLPSFFSGSS